MDVLGIDVGGTRVKGARVAADGTVLTAQSAATPSESEALTQAVIAIVGALRGDDTAAVGLVCPGVVSDGVAHWAANVPWRDEPVQERLRAAVGLPVVVEHDVAAAAMAESARLVDDDVLFVSLGTGIARAHVVNGTVRRGASGRAGEIGHIPVHPDGEACLCGQRGCLEAYASAAAIARRYRARTTTSLETSAIAARVGTDPDADAVWQDAVEALGLALATDTLLSDPGVIVLGGGLADAGNTLFEPVRAALSAHLAWRPAPPVRPAALGAAAGQLGAAQLAWRELAAEQEDVRT